MGAVKESDLLDMFIRQMRPPIVDDLSPDDPLAFFEDFPKDMENITTKFSMHGGVAYNS